MLDLSFECALLSFDRVWSIIRLCSTYTSTVLELSFECARPKNTKLFAPDWIQFDGLSVKENWEKHLCFRPVFRLCSTNFRPCSIYNLILHDLYFDSAWPIFRMCSTKFRPCLIYNSTLLDLYFDSARAIFRMCSTKKYKTIRPRLDTIRRSQCERKLRKAPLLSTSL